MITKALSHSPKKTTKAPSQSKSELIPEKIHHQHSNLNRRLWTQCLKVRSARDLLHLRATILLVLHVDALAQIVLALVLGRQRGFGRRSMAQRDGRQVEHLVGLTFLRHLLRLDNMKQTISENLKMLNQFKK